MTTDTHPAPPPAPTPLPGAYAPRRAPRALPLAIRGLAYHLNQWGDPAQARAGRPLLVMVHGWMDVGASFQFLVDALAAAEGPAGADRAVVAPDWRGFGRSASSGSDSYWFPDYLGDLDAILDALSPGQPVDLVGHSMGGNVVMAYAGARPQRIRRLVNLEGFGLPRSVPEDAPRRMARWLDELKAPQRFRSFDSLQAVAERLMQNNPRLAPGQAAWLAPHWSRQGDDGRWQLLGDPAHRRVNPLPYRVDEHLAHWACIEAPLLWVQGALTDTAAWWGSRYGVAEFHERLACVRQVRKVVLEGAGHMLHHDQPAALATHLADFLA